MAGVAEMLVQSHEGFVELLPALPEEWATGSADGLVARGNFEISMNWEGKRISSLHILSRSGGICKLKWDKPEVLHIKDSAGNTIPYKTKGNSTIEFNTRKSLVYSVEFL
jgi:alpha-L-fucosidase 2